MFAVLGGYFSFLKFENDILRANSGDPDRTSGLDLHCLSIFVTGI